jgi:hypothetical protein
LAVNLLLQLAITPSPVDGKVFTQAARSTQEDIDSDGTRLALQSVIERNIKA